MATIGPYVVGESLELLLEFLHGMKRGETRSDGSVMVSVLARKSDPSTMAFERAIARMEGRITTADVIREFESGARPRTRKKRREDAFKDLLREIALVAQRTKRSSEWTGAFGGPPSLR